MKFESIDYESLEDTSEIVQTHLSSDKPRYFGKYIKARMKQ